MKSARQTQAPVTNTPVVITPPWPKMASSPPRPVPVETLRQLLGEVTRGFGLLSAHNEDYQRLLKSPGVRLTQIPDDVETYLRDAKASAKKSGRKWTPYDETMERGIHGGIVRDRADWRLVHEVTPPIFQAWWDHLNQAIDAIAAVKPYLDGVVPLPGQWMMDLNAALRKVQGMTARFHKAPWTFAPAVSLSHEIETIDKAHALLTHSIFATGRAVDPSDPATPKPGLTAKELRDSTQGYGTPAIGRTQFSDILKSSGLRPTQPGENDRVFSPEEIRVLLNTAAQLCKRDRQRIMAAWEPLAAPI